MNLNVPDSVSPQVQTADGPPLDGRTVREVGTTQLSLVTQRRLLVLWLVTSDAAVLALAFGAAFWARFVAQLTVAPEVQPSPEYYPALTAILVPMWLAIFALFTLYDPLAKLGGLVESSRTFQACTVATMAVIVCTFVIPAFVISRAWLTFVCLFSFLAVAVNRFVARRLVYALRERGYLLRSAIIVGTNQEAVSLAAFLADSRSSGVQTQGFVSAGAPNADVPGSLLPMLGSTREIRSIVVRHGVEDVIVAITAVSREELLSLCEELESLPVELRLSSGLYELLTTRVSVRTLGNVPLMTLQKTRLRRGEMVIKTMLEWSLSAFGLLVLSPLFVAIAAWVKLDSPGPVLYRRRVLGAGKTQFDAFKFRTMHTNGVALLAYKAGALEQLQANHKLKNDPRITQSGQWLRRFSLDELPQLFNVLLGQMALVGPRMISPGEAEKYGRHRMSLLSVKPGITGLWQVSGRSDLSYDERVRLDMYYVRTYSVWMDLRILFVETLPAVLKGRGAY
jgi:exopolysaccharide biosynthesis polyprenyl glycosylphosphotransferase